MIISVTAFRPPRDGAVQAVVKVQRDGGRTEQEIGRFGMFPNAEFKAADPSKAQRFGLPLPKGLAGGEAVKLNVYLVPFKGDGGGAMLKIGRCGPYRNDSRETFWYDWGQKPYKANDRGLFFNILVQFEAAAAPRRPSSLPSTSPDVRFADRNHGSAE